MSSLRRGAVGAICSILLTGGLAACGAGAGGPGGNGGEGVASLDESADRGGSGGGGTNGEGSGDGGRPEATDAEKEDAMLDFAQCMRDHGIEMDDPKLAEDGGVIITSSRSGAAGEGGPGPAAEAEMEAADEACSPIMERVFGERTPPSPEEQARRRDEMLEFARCMRDHGVDMPDPEFSDGGMSMRIGEGADPRSEEFQAAQEACGAAGGGLAVAGGRQGAPGDGEDG